jgi:parvulin-like peptidyl-prolyl isomerase
MKAYIIIFAILILAFSARAEEIAKIVAKVNNEVITAQDLDEYYKVITYRMPEAMREFSANEKEAKKKTLEKLIEDRLILAEAKKENLEVYPYLVNGQVDKIISNYPSREEFEDSLIERGLNLTMLRERIKGQFLMRQLIDNKVASFVSISPQEISQYYKEHEKEIVSPPTYVIWIAHTPDKNILGAITKAVKEKGIAAAEKEYSNNLIKMEAPLNDLKDEIAAVVRQLKEGESSSTKIGKLPYFIYLEKIIPSRPLSLGEAQETIHNILWNMKFKEKFEGWVKQLKEKALIQVYL